MVDIRSTMGESVGMATGEGIRLSRCRHCHDGSGHRRVEHWPMHHAGEQTLRGRPMAWRSFVAMGDSFTEGMDDPYPDGTYRGWADLVAARLAVDAGPAFGYANLAIRGRLLNEVIDEQLDATLAMKPDLVSFAAGGNDVLRRKVDVLALVDRIDPVIGRLRATGADVILFRFADVAGQLPGQRIVGPRAAALNDGARRLA